ncbi:Gfo/Idh/MocA family protein [Jannaschia sp. M317]|uniref:Gfo/Idh/MocA family protein n=1 Tax=Jannaschia sp. M317 TaxID=2867011 RepID=UPI0021A4E4B5|nr:Gfo/Idh/MocA family oxidoreductase [Jannaschia sp. M317]
MSGRIRLGMVGGGTGAFIGAVHRLAARMDDRYDFVAGALSSTPERARESGAELGLDPARSYDDFTAMAKREARLKDGIQAVAIVTPNHMHAPAAREFLKRGIHVICDKPLTATLPEAKKLARAVEDSDALFILTHNYTAYPLVRQARAMVADGTLGELRVVQVEYPQDWLTTPLESEGQKQAEWRNDPAKTGAGNCVGDIGTHAHNLAEFITGQRVESLAADMHTFVPGRLLDDNIHVMLRFDGGARGMLWTSQVAPGNENGLRIRVYGENGGLEWAQENPNVLTHSPYGEPPRTITRAGPGFTQTTGTRVPPGHPEGYLEGFGNLYSEAADLIEAHARGETPETLLPGIEQGLRGMRFVDACVRSNKRNAAWVTL